MTTSYLELVQKRGDMAELPAQPALDRRRMRHWQHGKEENMIERPRCRLLRIDILEEEIKIDGGLLFCSTERCLGYSLEVEA
ncbi:hypothetical protein ACSFBM_33040 [Variovorax sp. GB1R11]|uniref:hypothetical protein n=1 Tax=Variovorax sp. GB1R11 TaxID=3443741 RepID=UPI003F471139